LETLSINFLIKDSPTAVAIVDTDMCFMSHSSIWSSDLCGTDKNIIGKSYYKVLKDTPKDLKAIHEECLKGKTNVNKGHKFIHPNGRSQWLKWKINPWKHDDGTIGGLIMIMEDITEQKRDEELLLKAESVARIGGWEVDLTTSKVYWTSITKQIHEVPEDYVPNLEEGINFYKAGEHRENITKLVSEAISDGTPWDTELIIVTANGKELWVRAMGDTEVVGGTCVRIFGTFQDIDAKKRAELKYQEVNTRLKIATEGAKVGVWDYDIVENKLVWDDNMYRLYGIRKEDFVGEYEAWQSGLHPEDKERGDEEIALAISGEKEFNTEFRVIWPSGEIRHVRAIAVTQRNEDGEAVKMVGTNWDITKLKNTQLQLIQTEESLQGTFENSSIGMALVELDGKWTKVNESLCSSVGYTEAELLKLTFQDITHPEDLEKDLTLLQELIDGKRESYQIEKRYYHKKGHIVYVLLTVTVVRNIRGEISHFISQIVDITSRTEAEKKLKSLLDVTSEQNNSLMNFAHIVSHNLRSHSSNLSMLSGFLAREKKEEERKNLVAMLEEASDSLNETVMHLNEVVQVKAHALEKMKSVNLYNRLKAVEKNIGILLKEKEAICIVNVPKKQSVKAIPAYLDSILLNLFTNSLKYSSPDRSPIIEITSEEKKDKLVVKFKDNGLGIDLDRHGKKLFGMYKTFHRHKDAKGIGLFITKNQIEAMNGGISVKSTVDVGTTFTLNFDIN